ncbi:hypothetical protein BdWA1_002867 [Babesia duncani]|uniref:Uncharacterized protein n=1 Tax=Babesia duncani TaxID=323732 RepID=A0AAD9PHY5_9APIC|nr:hypothetical protein BdWA1_002867 [Babesia duncani]
MGNPGLIFIALFKYSFNCYYTFLPFKFDNNHFDVLPHENFLPRATVPRFVDIYVSADDPRIPILVNFVTGGMTTSGPDTRPTNRNYFFKRDGNKLVNYKFTNKPNDTVENNDIVTRISRERVTYYVGTSNPEDIIVATKDPQNDLNQRENSMYASLATLDPKATIPRIGLKTKSKYNKVALYSDEHKEKIEISNADIDGVMHEKLILFRYRLVKEYRV